MLENNTIKKYEIANGLGTISFSSELVTSIILSVLNTYPNYKYVSHYIDSLMFNYNEVSLTLAVNGTLVLKEVDKIQRELSIIFKQSLSLNCVLIINIKDEK